MRRQLVPGLVVRLTVIKAKTWPGIEANIWCTYASREYDMHTYQGCSQDFEEGGATMTKEGAKRLYLVDQKPHLLLIT